MFVQVYGLDGDFWTVHSAEDFPDVLLALQSSLRELAHVAHEQASKTRETAGDVDDRRAEQLVPGPGWPGFGDAAGSGGDEFPAGRIAV